MAASLRYIGPLEPGVLSANIMAFVAIKLGRRQDGRAAPAAKTRGLVPTAGRKPRYLRI